MAEYNDLTAGGRLTVSPFVNPRKVNAMSEMVAGARLGGFAGERARTDLKETLSTSDAPHSFSHLVNLRNLPLYDEFQPTWNAIASTELVPDFEPTTFYSLRTNFAGLQHGKDNDGNLVAPRVAELDTYQYAFGYSEESVRIAVEKRGFKWGISLEKATRDTFGLVNRVPGDMLTIGQKTDDFVVYRALVDGVTDDTQVAAGTDYVTGDAVTANPLVSPAAIRVALRQIGARRDDEGNAIPLASRYHVIVPIGAGEGLEYELAVARAPFTVNNGSITSGPLSAASGLNRVASVIESEFIDDDHWYLVPAAGTTVRPSLIRVQLQGYTSPEVYVSNWNGAPVAGGASNSPYQAYSFDNDSVDLKFRMFTNAALVTDDQIIWSDGSGS
jgi:hypothetical protein